MNTLTQFQEQLITDIQKEFAKLNSKREGNAKSKKFSIETINNCINEEERFIDIVHKHNCKMVEAFAQVMLKEFEEFNNEFGEVIELKYNYTPHSSQQGTFEYMLDKNEGSPKNSYNADETEIFFVSKVKFTRIQQQWNYFNNADYFEAYLDFKREKVSITLESGKQVSLSKIIGVQYLTKNWLHRDDGKRYDSLDEMLQCDDQIQRQLVQLVQK